MDQKEHIDQQATALDEAEALIRKNADMINGYLARITELESQILHQTAISACRIEGRERLQKQIAALREIAIEQKAMRICTIPANWWNEGEQVKEYFRASARHQLAEEHPEAFR